MICKKTPLITRAQTESILETAHELRHWTTICKKRAIPTLSDLDPTVCAKVAMMSERFMSLSVTLTGRLEHPQLRSAAIALIASQHLNQGSDLDERQALNHWASVNQADAIATLNTTIQANRLPHWRFIGWGETARRQETALLLEAFAWLAGTQSVLNELRAKAGMDLNGWNDDAVLVWSWLAAYLGQGQRYLSDDGWNERYIDTQWRSNIRDGVDATIAALSTASSLDLAA